jgi:hypothetical protein
MVGTSILPALIRQLPQKGIKIRAVVDYEFIKNQSLEDIQNTILDNPEESVRIFKTLPCKMHIYDRIAAMFSEDINPEMKQVRLFCTTEPSQVKLFCLAFEKVWEEAEPYRRKRGKGKK